MASKTISLSVRPRGKPAKKLPEEISVPSTGSTSDLHQAIARQAGTSVHRLRVTKGSDGTLVPNAPSRSIHDTGLRDQSTIYVKDLGPQIAWRTVFLLEYLGPLLIHPVLYTLLASSSPGGPSPAQTLTLALVTTHFLKRELETLFVHRFSAATMPAANLLKNSAHYWLLAGANLAFWTYRPQSLAAATTTTTSASSSSSSSKTLYYYYLTYPALALFFVGELGNLYTHLVLRNLRSSGGDGTERGIPRGWGFGLVTCPNYMFEALAWVGVALVARTWAGWLFVAVALLPMGMWARKKEARYRREFGARYPGKRFVMVPGVW